MPKEFTPEQWADWQARRHEALEKEKKTSGITVALWVGAAVAVWYFLIRGK
jgi:hypothetical protein